MTTVAIDNKVKQVVTNIRNLPTPPIVFDQIQKVINSPNASAAQVASLLAEDPAMSVKVLKLTNSAFYGLSREIDSVKQAVVIIGMEAVKNLVLSASVLDMFRGDKSDKEFTEKFWRHSLATAFCSRILARKATARVTIDPDAAFSAGLLHDIGKIVVCSYLHNEYIRFNEVRLKDKTKETYVIENEVLGFNHAQIGAVLTTQWKLPSMLIESIANHHTPRESTEPLCALVNLANWMSKSTFYTPLEAHLVGELDVAVPARLGLTHEELEPIQDALREEYLKSETFMKMAGLS